MYDIDFYITTMTEMKMMIGLDIHQTKFDVDVVLKDSQRYFLRNLFDFFTLHICKYFIFLAM